MPEFDEAERAYLRGCATSDILRWLSTFSDEDAQVVLNHVQAGLSKRHDHPSVERAEGLKLGIPRPPGRGSAYTDEEKAEIVKVARSHTMKLAMDIYAVSYDSVRRWMDEAG